MTRAIQVLASLAFAAAALPSAAQAQADYPSKPVRIICDCSPGSPNDLIAQGVWPASGKKSLDGQAVMLGLTWQPTPNGVFLRYHVSDLWLDDAAIERVAEVISAHEPDVVALQELDVGRDHARFALHDLDHHCCGS